MGKETTVIILAAAAAIAAAAFFVSGDMPEDKASKPPSAAKTTSSPTARAERNYARFSDPDDALSQRAVRRDGGVIVVSPSGGKAQPTDKASIMEAMGEAAITYDPASLPAIAPHLSSRDPEIRAAAVNAVIVLGDAAGAPLLRDAAKKVSEPAEAADMRAKADYLELPVADAATIKAFKKTRDQTGPSAPTFPATTAPGGSATQLPQATHR